jgi:hypothetical protein
MKRTFFHSCKRIIILAITLSVLVAAGISQAQASNASFTLQSAPGGPYPETQKAEVQPSFPVQQGIPTTQVKQAGTGSPESDTPPATEIRKSGSVRIGQSPSVDDGSKPISGTSDVQLKPTPTNPSPVATHAVSATVKAAGWSTIMSENFEGVFPTGLWSTFDGDGATNGEYYWDDVTYKPHGGSWSAWPAAGGANGVDPAAYYYPSNLNSWMMYGPFDLSSSTDAELLFYYWNQSEANYDFFGWYASIDGSTFYGTSTSGDSSGWQYVNFDLTNVYNLGNATGHSSVWIAFVFSSDMNNTGGIGYDGPFVDDIVLQVYSQAAQPNLTPFTPSGWDFPIVPSATTGTHTVSTLYTNQNTYIDWSIINNGASTTTTFTSCLYYDNSQVACWNTTGGLNQSQYAFVEDWVLNLTPTPGAHTLKIVADVNNNVTESNENDNTWERSFTWTGSSQPNLTPYTPSGWDYPIVPSSITGTHTVGSLYTNQSTYIDLAVINTGASTTTTFVNCIYFDNAQRACWNTTGGLNQNQYAYVEDWILNLTPTAGAHTLKIITDVNNNVTESNENDNTWERSFTWTGPGAASRVYLSLALRDYVSYFEGPWEQEPNNTYLTANGPLRSGRDYNGYPNDEKDYFSVYLRTSGHIVIDLSNHNGTEVQLQLFYQNTANPPVASQISPPYHIDYTASAAGWYFIYIHSAGNYNSSTPYTLRVTYP